MSALHTSAAGRLGSVARDAAFLLLLGVLVLLPVVSVFVGTFLDDSPISGRAGFTLENYADLLPLLAESDSLANTVVLTVIATILSVGIGGAFAYLSDRTEFAGRRFIAPVMVLGYVIFPMITAMGYVMLADPYIGALNKLAQLISGDPTTVVVDSRSWGAVILVQSLLGAQGSYFLFRGAFNRIDRRLEEASLVAGRTKAQTARRITIPLLIPLTTGVMILIALFQFQAFTIPFVLNSDPEFVLTQIYRNIATDSPPRYGAASVFGLVTIAVALALGLGQWRLVRGRSFESLGARSGDHRRAALHGGRVIAQAGLVLYFLAATLIPVAAVVISSFTVYPGIYTSFTTAAYERVFADITLAQAARNSVVLSLTASLVALAISLIIGVYRVRGRSRPVAFAISVLLLLALGLPGVVQALGLTWAYTSVPGLKLLYGTNALVFIGLVVVIVPILSQITYGALKQISGSLEDAAVVAGSTRLGAFVRIVVPLIAPSLLGCWFVGAVIVFGTIDIPLILGAPGQPVLIQLLYTAFAGSDRSYAAALTTLFLAVLTVTGLLVLLVARLLATKRSRPALRAEAAELYAIGQPSERGRCTCRASH